MYEQEDSVFEGLLESFDVRLLNRRLVVDLLQEHSGNIF